MMVGSRIRWRLPTALMLVGFAITAFHAPADGVQSQAGAGAIAVAEPTPSSTPAGEPPRNLRVPVSASDHSFHQVAAALAQAVRTKSAAGDLFQFDAELGDYAGDASAQLAIRGYVANARFLLPSNDLRYMDAQWALPHPDFADLPDRGAWVREDDFASIAAEGESAAILAEPARLHPALRGWRIDREEIARAAAAHPGLFREGLMSVTVTSAIRATTPEKVFGITGADKSAALQNEAADHAVVAIIGVPHPCDIIHPGDYWTGYLCGNYLIIDGADGRDLAAGPYHEFHQAD